MFLETEGFVLVMQEQVITIFLRKQRSMHLLEKRKSVELLYICFIQFIHHFCHMGEGEGCSRGTTKPILTRRKSSIRFVGGGA